MHHHLPRCPRSVRRAVAAVTACLLWCLGPVPVGAADCSCTIVSINPVPGTNVHAFRAKGTVTVPADKKGTNRFEVVVYVRGDVSGTKYHLQTQKDAGDRETLHTTPVELVAGKDGVYNGNWSQTIWLGDTTRNDVYYKVVAALCTKLSEKEKGNLREQTQEKFEDTELLSDRLRELLPDRVTRSAAFDIERAK